MEFGQLTHSHFEEILIFQILISFLSTYLWYWHLDMDDTISLTYFIIFIIINTMRYDFRQ